MDLFIEKVYEYIHNNNLISPGDRLVVGLSGGADSVCLFLVLFELRKRLGLDDKSLYGVHINHMLRGEEADRDEKFAKEFCRTLNMEFVSYRIDVKKISEDERISVEEAGRKARYECFSQALKKYGCNKIAVAHNKNDMAETILFNMARGSGLKGIAGITPKRNNIIRPLLDVTRAEIEKYLEKNGQSYITDSTNLGIDYDRNKIRHIILPELEKVNSGALNHICQTGYEVGEGYKFIRKTAMEHFNKVVRRKEDELRINIPLLLQLDRIIQKQVLYEALIQKTGKMKDIGDTHIRGIMGLLEGNTGKCVELPYGIRVRKNYDSLVMTDRETEKSEYCMEIDREGVYKIPGWGNLNISLFPKKQMEDISKKIYTKMADYDKIKGKLFIRTPRDGDFVIIDNAGNTKKLTRVFIDNKVDREKRKSWPVIAAGSQIIWAIGLRYGESCKIDRNTSKILCMNYTGQGEENG